MNHEHVGCKECEEEYKEIREKDFRLKEILLERHPEFNSSKFKNPMRSIYEHISAQEFLDLEWKLRIGDLK